MSFFANNQSGWSKGAAVRFGLIGWMRGKLIPKVYNRGIGLANHLLRDKELFLRFPYHPFQKPAGNAGA
jgi:hypothetical protein